MKYAIVEIGGHQVWVEEGQYFITNKILTAQGSILLLKRILLTREEGQLFFGYPYLQNVTISCQVIEHLRGSKISVFKMKAKKGYRRKKGHRQEMTKLLVTHIKT